MVSTHHVMRRFCTMFSVALIQHDISLSSGAKRQVAVKKHFMNTGLRAFLLGGLCFVHVVIITDLTIFGQLLLQAKRQHTCHKTCRKCQSVTQNGMCQCCHIKLLFSCNSAIVTEKGVFGQPVVCCKNTTLNSLCYSQCCTITGSAISCGLG